MRALWCAVCVVCSHVVCALPVVFEEASGVVTELPISVNVSLYQPMPVDEMRSLLLTALGPGAGADVWYCEDGSNEDAAWWVACDLFVPAATARAVCDELAWLLTADTAPDHFPVERSEIDCSWVFA